jgi:hypothetical protein
MLGNGLGPWRPMLIYNLIMQFLNKNHISFPAFSSKMNKRLLLTLKDAVQTVKQ